MKKIFCLLSLVTIISCSPKLPDHFYTKSLPEENYVENHKNKYTIHTNTESAEFLEYTRLNNAKRKIDDDHSKVIVLKNRKQRPYIKMIVAGDTTTLANRHIDFKKVVNFRDIGGIKTKDNRTVKWGMIYRSDNLSQLKTNEFKKFTDLNIKTVFDLRTSHEIKGKEDHLPENVTQVRAPSVEDNADMLSQMRGRVIRGEISDEESLKLMTDLYQSIVSENIPSLRLLMQQILYADDPVLYHCSAGKDRTGIATAIILSILNVDRKTIMNEYLLSDYYRREKVEKMLSKANLAKIIKPRIGVKAIQNFMDVDERYLNAALNYIDTNYGGMDSYIKNQLGIDDAERKRIVAKFTY